MNQATHPRQDTAPRREQMPGGLRLLDALFFAYKRSLSPVLRALSPTGGGCGFQPTCSEYATLALAEHGWLRGGALALWRVLRCNPFCHGGWDPVPPRSRRRGL